MSNLLKRGISLLLVLVFCISLLPAISFNAQAEVSYVYDGKYIYNWGKRGEDATFLSPNAEAFYEKTILPMICLFRMTGAQARLLRPRAIFIEFCKI